MSMIMLALLATNTAVPPEQVRRHQATVSATIIEGFSPTSGARPDQRKQRQVSRDVAGNFILE
jgi:hypothetical protein